MIQVLVADIVQVQAETHDITHEALTDTTQLLLELQANTGGGVMTTPLWSIAAAVSCSVEPEFMIGFAGVIAIEARTESETTVYII